MLMSVWATSQADMNTTIKYFEQGGFQLDEEYSVYIPIEPVQTIHEDNGWITLNPSGLLTLLRGYAWNGPSVPPFIKVKKDSMRASAGHDALYQLFRQGKLNRKIYRKQADKIFREHLLEDKMPAWRAGLWYTAVRTFAAKSASAIKVRKVQTAP